MVFGEQAEEAGQISLRRASLNYSRDFAHFHMR